jgi:pimeloyl-ACP methyl ester carboxylesterase
LYALTPPVAPLCPHGCTHANTNTRAHARLALSAAAFGPIAEDLDAKARKGLKVRRILAYGTCLRSAILAVLWLWIPMCAINKCDFGGSVFDGLLPPLSRGGCQVYIIHGEDDKIFKVAASRKLADCIAGAELHTLPACGHVAHEELPLEFMELIKKLKLN